MKQLCVISGKGGTGKTVIAAALATLLPYKKVMADCDVDAANLELLLNPTVITTRAFYGMKCAGIDPDLCTGCEECRSVCRFGAISMADEKMVVNPVRCEGCAACIAVCPMQAISMHPRIAGEIFYSETEWGPLSHARLEPGAGTSGLLVAEVKRQANERAGDRDLMLIDGPPGIGCPLISTVSGTDAALIVTEPSIFGLHDLDRVITVCLTFHVNVYVIINKCTIDEENTHAIERYCGERGIEVVGRVPFDTEVIRSIRHRQPITCRDSPAATAIREIGLVVNERLRIS